MNVMQKKYWLSAIIRNPKMTKWYFHWRSSQKGRRSPLADELPWVTYEAIDWLTNNLTKEMCIFEWGSGGSTAFFAQHVKQVVTVEHDPLWYKEVVRALEKRACKNVLITLVEPVRDEDIDVWYLSTDGRYLGYSFEPYIKMIDTYPDSFFDVVFIDGRARPGCIKHAISKIKRGGYLLLDNSERTEYKAGRKLVQEWENIKLWGLGPYGNSPWETQIWQKRAA